MAEPSSSEPAGTSDPGRFIERETEDTRALLQGRLLQIGRYGQLVGVGFGFLVVLREILRGAVEGGTLGAIFGVWLVFAAVWLVTRRSRLSLSKLQVLESVATWVVCSLLVMIGYAEGDLVLALSPAMYALLLRAVFLPSSPWRTLAVTAASHVPFLCMLPWLLEKIDEGGRDSGTDLPLVAGRVAFGIAIPTVVSHVVYGLRNELKSARQFGPYSLTRLVGEGGMGRVYQARHAHLRRETAIKILRPDVTDEKSLARFEREVQATSQLTHPNTVVIYDYGRTADGTFYYVMEYLEGITLARLVRRHGSQPPARVIHFLLQACGSLREAHSRGIIHRDIKPENLVACERGGISDFIKVLDFGLVKNIRRQEDVALTAPDTVMGTPVYIPPEALHPSHTPDERTDVYALGVVGYQLLAGRLPFSGKNFIEISLAQLNTVPESPSRVTGRTVSRELEEAVLSCMNKEPGARPRDMGVLEEMLAACEEAGCWTQAAAAEWWKKNAAPGRRTGG